MGVGHHDMSWNDALHTYTLLTVGDGIVTQIPSLIIATATGIIITRAATDSKLGSEVVEQITAHPVTLLILAVCLFCLMFLPGLPTGGALGGLAFLAVVALLIYSYRSAGKSDEQEDPEVPEDEEDMPGSGSKDDIYKQLELHPIEVRLGVELHEVLEQVKDALYERVQNFRKQYALDSGFVVPSVKVIGSHSGVDSDAYAIYVYGVKLGSGQIKIGHQLAIAGAQTKVQLDGEKTTEPTYGLPAVWVPESGGVQMARAANYTLVDWQTMLITHLGEVIRSNANELLTRREVEKLLERNKATCDGLVEEIVPSIMSLTDIQRVFQLLLKENVPIRNIELILEVLADAGKRMKTPPEELVEEVRLRLGGIYLPIIDEPQWYVGSTDLGSKLGTFAYYYGQPA